MRQRIAQLVIFGGEIGITFREDKERSDYFNRKKKFNQTYEKICLHVTSNKIDTTLISFANNIERKIQEYKKEILCKQ